MIVFQTTDEQKQYWIIISSFFTTPVHSDNCLSLYDTAKKYQRYRNRG
jgi:hypothetical protein